MKKANKGITLIALVITIILLLILAGIAIAQLSEKGILEKAQLAKEKSENAQIKEEETLDDYNNKIEKYISGDRDTVTMTTEQYNSIINRLSELEENMQNKRLKLNTNYESKAKNTMYEAESDGLAYISTNTNPHTCNIYVYDMNGNLLYGNHVYLSSNGIDSAMTVYVPKGCKWKANANGGSVTVRWFSFE